MGEDDTVELLWKSGQIVRSSHPSDKPSLPPPPILRGSGSGGGEGEENAPLPEPSPHHHQNIFIQEDEMASWLHHPHFYSDIFYSGLVSTSATQPQSSYSLAPPPPPPTAPFDLPISQINTTRRGEYFTNFARLRGNILPGAGPLIPVVRESTQVGSNTTPSSSGTESCLTPAIHCTESRTTVIRGVSPTFAVPGLGRKEKAVAVETVYEIAGTSGSGVCKVETEPVQPATETVSPDDRKRKERQEPVDEIEGTKEVRGSTCRKRSRAAEMHNLSERRRREKLNEKMKALQEIVPRCNKSDKVSMLGDVIEYIKSLQMQVQMLLMGQGMMPMMYPPNMQQFMAMGMMGMDRPPFIPLPGTDFPRPAHMAGLAPSYPAPRYPFPNIQAFDPSRVHIPSQQPNPASNQPQFPGYMNPYSQFVGLQQMQQPPPPPPPLQNQTTSQLSFNQASSGKEPDNQENQPTG